MKNYGCDGKSDVPVSLIVLVALFGWFIVLLIMRY